MTLQAAQKKNSKDPNRTIKRFPRPSHLATPQKYGDGRSKELFIWMMCWGTVAVAASSLIRSIYLERLDDLYTLFFIATPLLPVLALIPPWRAWQRRRMRLIAQGLMDVKEPKTYSAISYHGGRAIVLSLFGLLCFVFGLSIIMTVGAILLKTFGLVYGGIACGAIALVIPTVALVIRHMRHTDEPEEALIDDEDVGFKLEMDEHSGEEE